MFFSPVSTSFLRKTKPKYIRKITKWVQGQVGQKLYSINDIIKCHTVICKSSPAVAHRISVYFLWSMWASATASYLITLKYIKGAILSWYYLVILRNSLLIKAHMTDKDLIVGGLLQN